MYDVLYCVSRFDILISTEKISSPKTNTEVSDKFSSYPRKIQKYKLPGYDHMDSIKTT